MKFTNGRWLIKKDVAINSPAEIYDYVVTENSITAYAPTRKIYSRGDTLGGSLLTLTLSSPQKDVIRVQVVHFKGTNEKGPEFEINEDGTNDVSTSDTLDVMSIQSGNLCAEINKENCAISFLYQNKVLTKSEHKSMSYITTQDNGNFMSDQLSLSVGELIYGLGERFTPFVKNGQTIEIWNEDGGTSTEKAYKNIPFYITNKGYGVFVNHSGCVSFEIGSELVSKVQFSVPGEQLEYFIIGGDTLKDVLGNYTALTGKPALPPAWSFGLWLTTSFTTDYNELTINSFIDGMKERDLPLHVFHFDCFWMKAYEWCNFEWNKDFFPDPHGMIKRLKNKGLKVCVWINPYIAQKSKLFGEGKKNGYFLLKSNGDVWQWNEWQSGMALVDFTNPEACRWYSSELQALLDMGVDSFKTDFGERIPTDVIYYDGSDPIKMHNYYTHLYNKCVFDLLEEKFGKGEATLFARSATAGGQQFPVHWGGDCFSDFNAMAESLRGGLSLTLSGFGFWSHDIGGFEDKATPDVYKRWVAFGLLSSHSRLHGSNSYRVPWLFDDEAVDVLRFFTKLKCSLMPYLFAAACEAANQGVPVMRAMLLEFPEDPTCGYLERQYMLGASLLVAPIFNQEGNANYYLPEGTWTNFLTDEKVQGGRWYGEKHGYMSIPLLARCNSIIAVGQEKNKPDYDYADGICFHLFELDNTCKISKKVFATSGKEVLQINVNRLNSLIDIEVSGATKTWSIMLRNVKNIQSASNATWQSEKSGIMLTSIHSNEKVEVIL